MTNKAENKAKVRVTMDIPVSDHTKVKRLAAFYGKSMREIFIEFIELGLEKYQECLDDHTPNETTKKALENAHAKKSTKTALTVEELFKKLG